MGTRLLAAFLRVVAFVLLVAAIGLLHVRWFDPSVDRARRALSTGEAALIPLTGALVCGWVAVRLRRS
jgi:hypothetical protein